VRVNRPDAPEFTTDYERLVPCTIFNGRDCINRESWRTRQSKDAIAISQAGKPDTI
jgi:hypothetical protein